MDRTLSRRTFAADAIRSVLTVSLLETLCSNDLFAADGQRVVAKWIRQVDALGRDVKKAAIPQIVWQKKVEELFAKVDLPDLLRLIDFENLTQKLRHVDKGARSLRFHFPKIEGIPTKLVFGKQIFALREGRSVIPHGHNNMATAFLILKGSFQGRHYDRLEDEPEHFIIKPTIDKKFGPGKFSTVSDFKDNIHWFKALSEPAFIFNIHILGVDPSHKKRVGRVYLDPNGEKLKNGQVRARRIGYAEAKRLYG